MSPRIVGAVGAATALAAVVVALVLVAWLAVIAGARSSEGDAGSCTTGVLSTVPATLRQTFAEAASRYRLGADGPAILAALTSVESGFGQNMGPSSAGAIGWTQFLPSTWRRYGVDADGDGRRDPFDPEDAIHSAANYLRASGAPADWRRALFAYNHAGWYVDKVLAEAGRLQQVGHAACDAMAVLPGATVRVRGGGRIVAIPGFPGESIDERLVSDVLWLVRTFRVSVTDGFASSGHAEDGEHPLGLAVDLIPGTGGSWDGVDRLARWAEPSPGRPRPPFRWVGYDGDAGHGRGDHLHLSWSHAPTPSPRPPALWVDLLASDG